MYNETTNLRPGHPFASTVADRRRLSNRLAKKAREEMPWEAPGLHGDGRAVRLRPSVIGASVTRRADSHDTGRLPVLPAVKVVEVRHLMIAAGVVGAVALGVYLWKQAKEQR